MQQQPGVGAGVSFSTTSETGCQKCLNPFTTENQLWIFAKITKFWCSTKTIFFEIWRKLLYDTACFQAFWFREFTRWWAKAKRNVRSGKREAVSQSQKCDCMRARMSHLRDHNPDHTCPPSREHTLSRQLQNAQPPHRDPSHPHHTYMWTSASRSSMLQHSLDIPGVTPQVHRNTPFPGCHWRRMPRKNAARAQSRNAWDPSSKNGNSYEHN